jgi:hypothetical protein
MRKQIVCGTVLAAGIVLLMRPASANRNFVPDWTFKGSSVATSRSIGDADWRAENGEIVGKSRTPAGGWLILDKPLEKRRVRFHIPLHQRLPNRRDGADSIDAGGNSRRLCGIAGG